MISIIHSKVYFILQTVKEFLLGKLGTERPAGRVWQQSLELAESNHLLSKIRQRSISFSEVELHQVSLGNALLPEDNREMEPSTYCRSHPSPLRTGPLVNLTVPLQTVLGVAAEAS
ncbi:hypothetical protein N7G274_001568 [Stereocaulon virgatum]|uniref:Uncharacterized protein n=1 Tax=Stereocaulon virgatum TaxID=373712 RepID=A0ABR4AKU6_9LECA